MRGSLAGQVLAGLVGGLAAGAMVAGTENPALLATVDYVEPIGTLWLNGLRMTIVPLVVSMLVTGVASLSTAAATGRVGARSLALIALLLSAAGLFTGVVTPAVLAWLPIDPATAEALRVGIGASAEPPPPMPPVGEWIAAWVPVNPVQAAAEGAMLPLVFFSLVFGLAVARLPADPRGLVLGFFRAVGEAMMVIVQWVLVVAPFGVFALVYPVGVRAGLGAVGALGYYVTLLCGLCLVATLAMYPLTALLTGVKVRRFAGAAAPAQTVAFSTRSSLASLPAMLQGAQARLGLSTTITGLMLPLTVSVMRITSPIVNLASGIFVAALFGIQLSPVHIAAGAAVAVVTSLSAVGLPSQVSFMTAHIPVFLAMGVPLEALGLLIAVDVIPDTFQTVGNVTADMAATTIVGHWTEGITGEAAAAEAAGETGRQYASP